MADVDVYVLHFEWEDGHSATIFPTKQAAEGHLYEIMRENWEWVFPDNPPIPDDFDTAVALYFEANEGIESYRIEHETMKVPDLSPAAQEDVVELTPIELRVVAESLNSVLWSSIGQQIGESTQTVANTVNSVLQKLELTDY